MDFSVVIDAAMNELDRMLRSLDAIHLATARIFGAELSGLATYDDRLAAAANDAGIAVIDFAEHYGDVDLTVVFRQLPLPPAE